MDDPTKDDPPDFELRKYEFDRPHELELNKFAHALEVERLKILQLVNGGAFTVLVAFATGLVRGPGWSLALAIPAGISWVLGLGVAAWATQRQLEGQAMFNSAYRYRRNAIEWRRLSARYGGVEAALMLPPLEKQQVREVRRLATKECKAAGATEFKGRFYDDYGDSYDGMADKAFYDGKVAGKNVKALTIASILLFVLGGILLAGSLAIANLAAGAA